MASVNSVQLVMPGSPITANLAATYFQGSQAVKGEIHRIRLVYGDTTSTGSVWIYESGTNVEIFRVNGFSADVNAYPKVQSVTTTNAAIGLGPSGTNTLDYPLVNGPLFLAGSGLGTTKLISGAEVYFL